MQKGCRAVRGAYVMDSPDASQILLGRGAEGLRGAAAKQSALQLCPDLPRAALNAATSKIHQTEDLPIGPRESRQESRTKLASPLVRLGPNQQTGHISLQHNR